MKVTLYSKQGNKKKEVVLNPDIYAAEINQRLLDLIRNAYSANLRRGTASTKTHKDVRGGGKKPWKQKGTGRARQGSIRSAQWRGGGIVFGPHPRDYTVSISKEIKHAALISALSLRAEQKSLILLEDSNLETPKTKEWVNVMNALPNKEKRVLCVVRELGKNLKQASRNALKWADVQEAREVNAYHILQRERLVIEEEALPILEGRLLSGKEPVGEKNAEEKKIVKKTVVKKTAAKKKPAKE